MDAVLRPLRGGGRRGNGRNGDGADCERMPVVRQKLREVAVFQRAHPLEHVLEIGPGIVPVEFGRLDQARMLSACSPRLL